jgi:lysozyme
VGTDQGLREISQAGLALIKAAEGLVDGDTSTVNIDPYLDPVGIWTIGWGHAIWHQVRFLRGDADRDLARSLYRGGLTEPQAERLLAADLMEAGRDVLAAVDVALNDNEYAALVSFTFNLGVGNLRSSTLLRLLNAGDRIGAAGQFGRWVLADGQRLPGLVKRRETERLLFLSRDGLAPAPT